MKGNYSLSIETAQQHFPALKRTVYLAEKYGIKLVSHYYQLTNRGKVCCHWWLVLDKKTKKKEFQRNQILLGMLRNFDQYEKNKHLT
jgi:hypothetical protein